MLARCIFLIAVTVLVVPFTLTVSRADDDKGDDRAGGLQVQVDAWWVQPRNTGLDYAFSGVGGLAGGGDVQSVDHDRASRAVFYAGWRLATSPATELGMRFWDYEDVAHGAVEEDQGIGPLLASPAFLGLSTVDEAEADSSIRAMQVDGGARWTHAFGDAGRLGIEAGVRFFRFERKIRVTYEEDFGQKREVFVNMRSEARGLGPRAGIDYEHRYGKRVGLGTSLGLAFPVGDLDARNRQEFLVDDNLSSTTDVRQPEKSRAFFQLDGELRVSVDLWGGWQATAAYTYRHWAGAQRNLRLVDVAAQAAALPVDEDAVWEGFALRLRYSFD